MDSLDAALEALSRASECDAALDALCDLMLAGNALPHADRLRVLDALAPTLVDAKKNIGSGRRARVFRALVLAAQALAYSQNRDEAYAAAWNTAVAAAQCLLATRFPGAHAAESSDVRFVSFLLLASYCYQHRDDTATNARRATLLAEFTGPFPDECPRVRALTASLQHALGDAGDRGGRQLFPAIARAAMLVIILAACAINLTVVSQVDRFPTVFALVMGGGLLIDALLSSSSAVADDKNAALMFAPALFFAPAALRHGTVSSASVRRAAAIAAVPLLPVHVVKATIDDESSDEDGDADGDDDEEDDDDEEEHDVQEQVDDVVATASNSNAAVAALAAVRDDSPPPHARSRQGKGPSPLAKFNHVPLQKLPKPPLAPLQAHAEPADASSTAAMAVPSADDAGEFIKVKSKQAQKKLRAKQAAAAAAAAAKAIAKSDAPALASVAVSAAPAPAPASKPAVPPLAVKSLPSAVAPPPSAPAPAPRSVAIVTAPVAVAVAPAAAPVAASSNGSNSDSDARALVACRHFLRGNCNKGAQCPYAHHPVAAAGARVVAPTAAPSAAAPAAAAASSSALSASAAPKKRTPAPASVVAANAAPRSASAWLKPALASSNIAQPSADFPSLRA